MCREYGAYDCHIIVIWPQRLAEQQLKEPRLQLPGATEYKEPELSSPSGAGLNIHSFKD
jgi:hypothetical protein